MLLSATYLLEQNPHPTEEEIRRGIQGNICRCTGYVNIVEAIQSAAEARRERDADRHRAATELQIGYAGTSIPRKEDNRLVQGEGSSPTTSRRTGWATSTSSARRTRTRRSSRSTSRQAEALEGVYGTLTPDEVAAQTDPFFELTTPPGNEIKDFALAVGKVRHVGEPVVAVVAARATSPGTPPTSSRSSTTRSRARRRAQGAGRGGPSSTTMPARTSSGRGRSTGATSTAR